MVSLLVRGVWCSDEWCLRLLFVGVAAAHCSPLAPRCKQGSCKEPAFTAGVSRTCLRAGINRGSKRPMPSAPQGSRRGGGGGRSAAHPFAAAAAGLPHVSKRQRIDSFVANPPPFGTTAIGRAAAAAARQQQEGQQQLSLSQVDPSVLAELPPDVRREVLQQLQQVGSGAAGAGKHCGRQQHRSRLGQQQDQERAWQQRWEEEQQQRELEAAAAAGSLASDADDSAEEEEGQHPERQEQDLLPPAVQQFLAQAQAAPAASSLAAALADCLRQLESQLASEVPASPAVPPPGSGGGDAAGNSSSSPAGSSGGGSGGVEMELPPTQVVEVEGQEQPTQQQAEGGDGAGMPGFAGGSAGSGPQQSPRQDSMQRRGGTAAGQEEVQAGLQALGSAVQQAAAALLSAKDLEQLRLLLLAVRRLARRHPCFGSGAGETAIEAVQLRVQGRYGWRLRLAGLLDGEAPGCEEAPS